MTEVNARVPQVSTIEATIIRADGTVIPLGKIADKNWSWYSPEKWGAWYRTKKANRAQAQGSKH